MFFKWDDSLYTGIKWIDEQHKNYFKKMDIFLEATCRGKGGVESFTALKASLIT